MANYIVTDTDMTAVAEAIRAKRGTSDALEFPGGFVDAVSAIETGGEGYTIDDLATNNITGEITITATKIQNYAFYGRSKITAVHCHTLKDISSLGKYAFQNCTGLKTIDIVANPAWLGANSFSGCTALEEVELNAIGFENSVFENCTSLKRAIFPYFQYSNDYAFHNCTSLEYFDAGRNTTGTSGYLWTVFTKCTNLKTLVFRMPYMITCTTGTFSDTPFARGGTGGILYVPEALIATYQANANWATILGYENNQILAIEGSEYE